MFCLFLFSLIYCYHLNYYTNILTFYISLNIYICLCIYFPLWSQNWNFRSMMSFWYFCTYAFICVSVVLVSGFDENLAVQGELMLQDTFQVWDPKSLIRKGRDRHLFLFEISLVFSKEMKDSSGRTKYVYKNKLLVRSSRMTRCQEV